MKSQSPFEVCCPGLVLIMNFIDWNCRGALKALFQNHVRELVNNHNHVVMIIMETKVGGERARDITDRLPFDGVFITETIGYAGGLWLLWDSNRVEISPLSSIEQEIHVTVKVRSSNFSWLLLAIYASPRHVERQVLWNNLTKVTELHNMPWVLVGDFNEPIVGEDKFGGRLVSVNRSLMLKECLDICNMIDLGFIGPRFTWTNRREVQGLIQERIDRFFVNPSWCIRYPEAKVSHLTRCHSDHCPVLLELQPTVGFNQSRPFKFQCFWLSDVTFPKVVENV